MSATANFQIDPFAWLNLLSNHPDPAAFAAQMERTMQVCLQVKQLQDEQRQQAEAAERAVRQAEIEETERDRLIYLVLSHVRSLGIDSNTLPLLKRKALPELRDYIQSNWRELSAFI